MRNPIGAIPWFIAGLFVLLIQMSAATQTAGTFDLSHSVIASGGGSDSTGGSFRVDGTIGQNLAGTVSTATQFSLRGGFWAFQNLSPTAADAAITGRIKMSTGVGVRNVSITLTSAATGEIRFATSSSFGYYHFNDVRVGETYILSVHSRRFTFTPENIAISLFDNFIDADFTAR